MIKVKDIVFNIAGRTIIKKGNFAIPDGWKVGLIGKNGAGKTTLFKLLLGMEHIDDGEIDISEKQKIGTVAQQPPMGENTLLEEVLSADKERNELLHYLETHPEAHDVADVYERLAHIDAYTAEQRAEELLKGLGFTNENILEPCSKFSGGWRMRVALASALFANPDILLLDEPSNHLDLEASMWLENYLKAWKKTIVVISHERSFLNTVCDHIIHLQNGETNMYTGNYDTFERELMEKRMLNEKMKKKMDDKKKHLQAFVDRFKAKASKAKQAQSRVKMIERLPTFESMVDDYKIDISFPETDDLPPPIITIDHADIGYSDSPKPVLNDVDFRVDPQERIGLLGANGNGKSTLIKAISKQLPILTGELRSANKLKIGYFTQHQVEELNPDYTVLEQMRSAMENLDGVAQISHQMVMNKIGALGFPGERSSTKVGELSGGERARLALTMVTIHSPHIILLDEPTNHLDIDTRKSLVSAITQWNGTVILVSHDIDLLSMICDRFLLVANNRVTAFDGDVDDYKNLIIEERRVQNEEEKEKDKKKKAQAKAQSENENETNQDGSTPVKKKKVSSKEERKLKASLRKLETKIRMATSEKETLELKFSTLTNGDDIKNLQSEIATITDNLVKLEHDWLILTEKL